LKADWSNLTKKKHKWQLHRTDVVIHNHTSQFNVGL